MYLTLSLLFIIGAVHRFIPSGTKLSIISFNSYSPLTQSYNALTVLGRSLQSLC